MSDHYSGAALKKGAIQYLTGKVVTASLTFAILITMVRVLPLAEYGAYLVFASGVELCNALAGFGIPWVASRYLPEYKVHASGARLKAFCQKLIGGQIVALLCCVVAVISLLNVYLHSVGLSQYKWVALCFVAVFFIEALGRFYRDFLFGPLLLQKEARISLVARHLSLFLIIFILGIVTQVTLKAVVLAELTASTIAFVIAYFGYQRNIKRFEGYAGEAEWIEPPFKSQWKVAFNMYFAYVLTLTYSPHVLINLLQRYLGPEASALFGFLRNLNDQIARNLPASLLINFIRPKLVANYVKGGGITGLSRDANLAGKLSLFVLMPLIIFSALGGAEFIKLLSGGKFYNSGYFLLGFVGLVLLPFSQRHTLESVAVVLGKAKLCSIAAFSGLIMLPIVYLMLDMGLGIWSAILAIGAGHFLFNIIVVGGLNKLKYTVDYSAALKLFAATLIAYLLSRFFVGVMSPFMENISLPISLMNVFTIGSLIYLLIAWLIKPFNSDERARLNRIINRKVFVW